MMMIEEAEDTDQEVEAQDTDQDPEVHMKRSVQDHEVHMKGKGHVAEVESHIQGPDQGHMTEEDQGQEVGHHHTHLLVKSHQPKVDLGHLREIKHTDHPPKNKNITLLVTE